MSIIYPSNRKQVFDRVATDIQTSIPESEPFLRNSYIEALAIGFAGMCFDLYKTVQQLQKQLIPDTATGEFADRWGSFKGFQKTPATKSSGNITTTGTLNTPIPINTLFQSNSGAQYISTTDTIISSNSISTFLTRSGNTVTALTSSDHHLVNGANVVISNAYPNDYNGTHQIVVTAKDQFTFPISTTPISPAIGAILTTYTFANVSVESVSYGLSTNLASGSELFLTSMIAGVDNSSFVQFDGLTGGSDIESDTSFKNRYLYGYQHPVSFFNVAQIVTKCEEENGVTRVFVQETTPDVGQVTIYFVRDNDDTIIPSPSQIATVKDHLLTIKPAHVSPDDVIVKAPTPHPVAFKFTLLSPNTDSMRQAIVDSLKAFFAEVPIVGQSLSRNSYTSAIYYTVDPATGQLVDNFVLAEPIGEIPIASGELATFEGDVTWPSA